MSICVRQGIERTSECPQGSRLLLTSALLFGATTPIAKQLLNGASPLLVAGLLYLGSGVGLALLRLVQDRGLSPTTLKRSDWPWVAAATASGGVLAPALLLVGLTHSDAATAAARNSKLGRRGESESSREDRRCPGRGQTAVNTRIVIFQLVNRDAGRRGRTANYIPGKARVGIEPA